MRLRPSPGASRPRRLQAEHSQEGDGQDDRVRSCHDELRRTLMNLIKTFAVFSGLSSVNRYSMVHLGNPESVLEHIGMVAMLSSFLAREINCRDHFCVEIQTVMGKALVHDIDELIVGDVPRPTKYASKQIRAMFKDIESRGVLRVVTEMDWCKELSSEIIRDHAYAKSGREGLIVG